MSYWVIAAEREGSVFNLVRKNWRYIVGGGRGHFMRYSWNSFVFGMAFQRRWFNQFLHPHKRYIRTTGKTNTHTLLVQRTKNPTQMFTKQPQKTGRKTNIQRCLKCRATNKHRKKISMFLAVAFEHTEAIWGNPSLNFPHGRFELSVMFSFIT